MTILLPLLSQVPIIDFDKYKAAYEPYRRCVVAAAKAAYPSGNSLRTIYEAARRKCADAEAQYVLDATIIELNVLAESQQPGTASALGSVFEEDLLLQLADDFVPRKK